MGQVVTHALHLCVFFSLTVHHIGALGDGSDHTSHSGAPRHLSACLCLSFFWSKGPHFHFSPGSSWLDGPSFLQSGTWLKGMIWAIELDQTGSSLEYLLQLRPRTDADDTGHRHGETETDQVEAGWGPPCLRPRQCWNVCIVQRFCLGTFL